MKRMALGILLVALCSFIINRLYLSEQPNYLKQKDYLKEMGSNLIIDTGKIEFPYADTFLNLKVPLTHRTPANNNFDINHVVHPSVIYVSDGWPNDGVNSWRYWLCGTPYNSSNLEDPCIWVSNDNQNWQLPIGGVNPVADTSDIGDGHLSDGHLFFDKTGKLQLIWRGTEAEINTFFDSLGEVTCWTPEQNKLYIQGTHDGVNWSTPKVILSNHTKDTLNQSGTPSWADTATAMGNTLISPAIAIDPSGTYKMWLLNMRVWYQGDPPYCGTDTPWTAHNLQNVIELWESPYPDSGWVYIDTVPIHNLVNEYYTPLENSNGNFSEIEPWHLDVMSLNSESLLLFLTCSRLNRTAGYGGLRLGVSDDFGRTFSLKGEPILDGHRFRDKKSDWDGAYTYKAAPILIEKDNVPIIGLYYSAFGFNDSLGFKGKFIGYTESQYKDSEVKINVNDTL